MNRFQPGRPGTRSVPLMALPILMLATGAALATAIPGMPKTWELRPQQDAAEAAFEAGEYGASMTIYLEDLAPAGDKYAQYMIGWMHLNGLGVDADPVLGAAWIAVAAEHGDSPYASVRDEILSQFDGEARRAYDDKAGELMALYGNCALARGLFGRKEALIADPTRTHRAVPGNEAPRFGWRQSSADGTDPDTVRAQTQSLKKYLRANCR